MCLTPLMYTPKIVQHGPINNADYIFIFKCECGPPIRMLKNSCGGLGLHDVRTREILTFRKKRKIKNKYINLFTKVIFQAANRMGL